MLKIHRYYYRQKVHGKGEFLTGWTHIRHHWWRPQNGRWYAF